MAGLGRVSGVSNETTGVAQVSGTGQSPGIQVSQMRHLRAVQVSGTGHLRPDPRAGQLRRNPDRAGWSVYPSASDGRPRC